MNQSNPTTSYHRRTAFLGCMLLACILGLGSRRFADALPEFIADNAGDAFWTALVFCGFSFLFPVAKIRWRALATITFAYAIEISQLYHAPWIDSIRSTTLGGLVLGFQFVWVDLVRYAIGVLGCVVIELASVRLSRQP